MTLKISQHNLVELIVTINNAREQVNWTSSLSFKGFLEKLKGSRYQILALGWQSKAWYLVVSLGGTKYADNTKSIQRWKFRCHFSNLKKIFWVDLKLGNLHHDICCLLTSKMSNPTIVYNFLMNVGMELFIRHYFFV